jgi:hypothetical protein
MGQDVPVVSLAKSCQISKNLMLAVTSAKLSPTATHGIHANPLQFLCQQFCERMRAGLLGYGVRKHGFVEKHPRSQLVACEIFALHSMESVAIMNDDVDEVSTIVTVDSFALIRGWTLLYR